MKRPLFASFSLLLALVTAPGAQMRVAPIDEVQGHLALGLALRHLANTGVFMMATAHPDDEDNGLLVMLNRGRGYRTALATATRGNGGQNEIGPELFEPLAVLRTEELAAMHRFDGAEQYFTRAVDFGYSVSIEETFAKWGREETVGDFVRLIRMVRPDVMTALTPTATGPGQHQHHSASAVLAHEAFELAGDATKYPEQLREGLRPWQPKKFYFRAGFAGAGNPQPAVKVTRTNLSLYDSLLGKTYSEIGTEARSMHKCQGQAQLLSLPGIAATNYQLAESTIPGALERDEQTLFEGVDTSIAGLAKFAGTRTPRELKEGLAAIASSVQTAQKKFDAESDEATLQPLLLGLNAVRALRGQLRSMPLDEGARFEIDMRLRQKEREFQQAALIAGGIRVEALADDGIVVPGQPVRVSILVANHGPVEVGISHVRFDGFEVQTACSMTAVVAPAGPGAGRDGRGTAPTGPPISALKKDQIGRCDPALKIPTNARATEPYWHLAGGAGRYVFDEDAPFGLPNRPTPFYVQVSLAFAGAGTEEVVSGLPVQYRYEGNVFSGEKRTELLVVPPLSVRMSPDIAIVPAAPRDRPAPARPAVAAITREVRVTVVNGAQSAVDSAVKLDLPQGWTATPSEQPVKLGRQDESQTVRFQVRPAANAPVGSYEVKASASVGDQWFDRGFQVVEYPHIRRRHIYDEAAATLKVIDVKTIPNLTVGYITGVGDQVPPAIEQLGAKVELIGADALAWGDLSRFDAIVTGVRAYERRDDLRANNSRLLEYVRNGGALIVQYNRQEFNEAQYGPYPAKIGNDRVTDERAPVQLLEPGDPVFNAPNKITDAAWNGWVQERGLYFLTEKDSRYRDLVQVEDTFPNNKGVKRGVLVDGRYGKGRWIYVGLGLWRELPAGVDGAYQLLANLIGLGKTASSTGRTTAR